jgi:60 kDa SS-A/Ro ribonucleoprotein
MSVLNKKVPILKTHEGATAKHISYEQQLRRSVLSCMLFENGFYENGQDIAECIKELIAKVDPLIVSKLAVEAREKMGLRHVPLLIIREMARLPQYKRYVSRTLSRVITRPDQLTDFVSLYWQDNNKKKTLSSKVKTGLAFAFQKFSEYDLRKYNRLDKAVKLRDVLFLCHAKPKDEEQAQVWKRLINNELTAIETWETLSAAKVGENKGETWEKIIDVWVTPEKINNQLALLRNLRNCIVNRVSDNHLEKLKSAFSHPTWDKKRQIFPYQYIAAAKHAPTFEPELEQALFNSFQHKRKFQGKTVILVDVSGSMSGRMSSKSEMTYMDAACALAMMLREMCETPDIWTFSNQCKQVPPRRGFALRDAIINSQPNGGTDLRRAVIAVQDYYTSPYNRESGLHRLIVITDEQSQTDVPDPKTPDSYVINVATNKNGIGYGKWSHIDGFSSATLDWIYLYEEMRQKMRAEPTVKTAPTKFIVPESKL